MNSRTVGQLFLVATPIGNLGDLTDRAKSVLREVQVVAAEDTRHSGQLLTRLGIQKPLVSLHEHNERQRLDSVLNRLMNGESVALVSDAGTPLVSDPGFELVRAAIARGVMVIPIPGACAVITALSAAGLPTDRFCFEGFLPAKAGARRERLSALNSSSATLVFYEAPHRLEESLSDMALVFGNDRSAVVARELTKQYESFYRGTLRELVELAAKDKDMSRGEIVIVVEGIATSEPANKLDADTVLRTLLEELAPAQAAKLAAKLTGLKKRDLYDRAMEMTNGANDRR